ncbi:PAS-domain containing protein [Roseococcus sp. YIM B11640]|uniref:PAS-domain containing protein n=1 Tax=Roseococcus sp. YIM B11640 TaxID=3133973 RepID=UPI003C7BB19E
MSLQSMPPEAAAALLPVLLEGMTAGVCVHDSEGRRLLANARMDELLGLSPPLTESGTAFSSQLAALRAQGILRDHDAEALARAFAQEGRAEVAWLSGTGRYLAMTVMDAPGGQRLGICRDQTAAREAEAKLAAARRRAELLLRHTRDVVVLMEADGTILENSDRTGDLLGLPPELAAPGSSHQKILRFMAERGDFGPVEDIEAFVNERRGRIIMAGAVTYSTQMPSGTWVEYNFRVLEDGRLLVTIRDITALKETQIALERERAMLNTVISNLPDGVMLFDADFRWRMANERLMEFQALTPDVAFPGAHARDILRFQARRGDFGPVPEDEATLEALIDEREAIMRRPGGAQYVRFTAGGFWIEFNTRPLPDGGLLAFYRDVTPLKMREAELDAERSLLREVVDSSDSMLTLFDAHGKVLLANLRHEDLMGIPQILFEPGRSLEEGIRWFARNGFYGMVDDEDALVRRRMEEIYSGEVHRHSRQIPDGRWLEFAYRRISGGRLIAQARDITELKQREAELETERTLLREVLDSTDSLVTLFDEDGRITIANGRHEELMGAPQELFAPGRYFQDGLRFLVRRGDFGPVAAEEEDELVRRRLKLVFGMDDPGDSLRYARQMPDGRWVEFTYTLLSGGRLISHARDVTPLKASEQAALAAQAEAEAARDAAEAAAQAKSAFLAAMSHEIRTPMNGVLGMLEILERSDLAVDQARSVAVMRESAQSLLRIIDDVLDFSKIEAGRMEVETLPFSLRGLIDGTIEALMSQARRRGIAFFADPPGPGPDWLEGDPTRVRQILFNLIGNALKFTERGFVRIGAETREENGGAFVTLTVEDSGVGMDAGTLARLFQPFTQADSSTTRRFGGTGLGLSIVSRLAELMDGSVSAESTPGRGSRFTVTLRLGLATAPAPVLSPEVPASAPLPPAGPQIGRVLVVDDHPVNREVITRQLELLGIATATADDGAKGLADWRRGRPSVVLLDIHMPVMDGFELARAIRAEEARGGLPRTTLIAVTANAMKGEAERCYAAGMDGFVTKPVTLEGLSRALGRFMPGLGAAGGPAGGALFDPEALRGLFGQDRERLLGILDSFSEQASHDIAGLQAASGPRVADAAHRLKGSARMVGARLLAEAAQALEEAARRGDSEQVEAARGQLPSLLAETLAVARPALMAGGGMAAG